MTEFKNGSVKVSNNIIDQLVAESAMRVEGVDSVIGYKNKKLDAKKKDGIVTVIADGKMSAALTVILKNGVNIYETCENIQKNVAEQIKVMLNLDVTAVNVIVKDVVSK